MQEKETFTRRELANHLNVALDTVRKWQKKGLIQPAFYVTNRPRYSKETVEMMKSHSHIETPKIVIELT